MTTVRTACHVHSEWSFDGQWPIERIAETFHARGYRVVMMTEHDQGFDEARRREHVAACRQASNENILVIPGIEYSDPTNTIHLLVWGDVPFIGEQVATEKTLEAAKAAGGIVVLAHPSRRAAWKMFKPEWSGGLLGIELWNRKTDGWAPSKDGQALIEASGLTPFVGLDFHSPKQFFPLAMKMELDGPVTEAAVLKCMKARKLSCEAFGRPVQAVSEGAGAMALHTAEFVRRKAAALYHSAVD
jgi:predicted metal-dependent phosphoesterase TrpH